MTTLPSHRPPLVRLLCTFTEECIEMIDALREEESRSTWIERNLWELNQKKAAYRGIKRPERHGRGRPLSN